jgi:hypothetical protein
LKILDSSFEIYSLGRNPKSRMTPANRRTKNNKNPKKYSIFLSFLSGLVKKRQIASARKIPH